MLTDTVAFKLARFFRGRLRWLEPPFADRQFVAARPGRVLIARLSGLSGQVLSCLHWVPAGLEAAAGAEDGGHLLPSGYFKLVVAWKRILVPDRPEFVQDPFRISVTKFPAFGTR